MFVFQLQEESAVLLDLSFKFSFQVREAIENQF